MLNLEMLGNKITKHRKENKMTQMELAESLYVTHQAVSKWENGISIPSIEILFEITKLFKVSIDYLLSDVEIKRDDYASLISNYSRETAINRFLNCEDPNKDLHKIYYLLSNTERELILNLLISKKLSLNIPTLWSYLNNRERQYLLGVILSNKFDYDLSEISHRFTNEESMICRLHGENYNYPLRIINH